ncbi:DUF3592 domain-containing protein [Actinomadura sp. 7K507]|uniref:DUF3592 domain-containing protein n=1 Tax=Actinomadura sp. 7K507 TaxID=2530365 RepID=UPI0010480B19|nr:DUF3592 domain-containing protein [Actinomadura sp. 7K507]TDC79305.1 hypothetical protein E1285_36305 [Actinomadura sp. 7K507]
MGSHKGGRAKRGRFMWARWILIVVLCGGGVVIALCVPIIGFSLLADGVEEMGAASALSDRGRHTIGTVQDTRAESSGPGSGVDHYMLVGFAAPDGGRHDVWVSGEKDVGDAARVLYDPRDPEVAITGSVTGKRVDGIVHIIGGAIMSIGVLIGYAVGGWSRLRSGRPRGAHGIT